MKHSFCEGLQKDFVHLGCAAGGFWWSAVESQTRAANLLAASPLFFVGLAALPLVFVVPPRATKPQLYCQLSRLVHLGVITVERIIVVTAFVIHNKVEKRCESPGAELQGS